jgi:NitT/TauT family transport system substrate-binding protein
MLKRTLTIGAMCTALVISLSANAQDVVKYGTAVKLSPVYYLPILTGQAQGIFARHKLSVEWIPSESGPDFQRNLASNIVDIGNSTAATDIPAMSRGVPAAIVATLQSTDSFAVWVGSDSRFAKPEDLNGAKFGVSRLSGAEHAYGMLVARQLGLKDVQFVGTGGIRESLAVLVTKGIDGVILQPQNLIELKLSGRIKPILQVTDYLPKPWLNYTVVASRNMIEKRPDVLKRLLASIIEANRFVMSPQGKSWAISTMKEQNKYSDEGARQIYDALNLSTDGNFNLRSVENAANFLVEFGIMKRDEIAKLDTMFTDKFLP